MQTDSLEIKILSLLLVLETFLHIQEKKKEKRGNYNQKTNEPN